ncbi:hypothetical protein D3C74_417910 [compost metagenome]
MIVKNLTGDTSVFIDGKEYEGRIEIPFAIIGDFNEEHKAQIELLLSENSDGYINEIIIEKE